MKHSEAFEKLVAEIRPQISEITIDAILKKRADNDRFTLIDVREDHEWSTGYIDGAFHLGKGIIERDIEKHFPDRDTCLVLYCGGGYRSTLATYNLKRMGYSNVHSMQGGYRTWCDRGFPVSGKICKQ